MTKTLSLFSLATIFFLACNQPANTAKKEETKKDNSHETIEKEFTPFIISEILLYDTSEIKTVGHGEVLNGQWFPTENRLAYNSKYKQMSANQMQVFIQNLIHAKNSNAYLDLDSKKLSKYELFGRVNCCDSIEEWNEQGTEARRRFICDSMTMYKSIKKIIFYEKWDLNAENGSIDKEILGYTLCEKLEGDSKKGKDNYKSVIHFFKDEDTREKVKKYIYIKSERAEKS